MTQSNQIQVQRAKALRQLHDRQEVLLLPNAWDAGSARLLASHDFQAIATTSGGVAWALGYTDGEQTPLEEVLAVVRRIVRVVEVPVTVDFESGYGASPTAVAASVKKIIATGAVGINLEDSMPGHGPLRSIDEAAARIQAARQAATDMGVPVVINARIDNWMQGPDQPDAPLAEATARAHAYLTAGADCVYPIGLSDLNTMQAFVEAVDAPVNMMAGPGTPPLEQLAQIGVARISVATWLTLLAFGTVNQAVRTMRTTGRFDGLATTYGYMDAQNLFLSQ